MLTGEKEFPIYHIKVHHKSSAIADIPLALKKELDQLKFSKRFRNLKPGASIAITAGSRGISNYTLILKTIVKTLKEWGYEPFLFSAMGSHGGGTAEGQQEILQSLNINPETVGCPVYCSSEVKILEEIEWLGQKIPVYCAAEAINADGVLVVNRIKPHTSFHGNYESGLLKMMTVGMGRAKGADRFHSLGATHLADAIPLIAGQVLERAPIVGGIGIVENEHEKTAIIKGIPFEQIVYEEKSLLLEAKRLMPKLPLEHADLCIVGEMGKNFSGTGMDTNIIGRLRIQGIPEPTTPYFTYLGVLRLSEPSHGNATGIGLADFTTQKLVQEIDSKATYLNCLTSGFVIRSAVPMTFNTDKELVQGALQALKYDGSGGIRLLFIKNTLYINELWVSKAIYDELKDKEEIELVEKLPTIPFDADGNWI
ncbi:DUF2088 domain-containing protein [Neobacillus sp. PS3-12]|uniref:DUF2088 domain-containing protein n=1 Tax=Neobacillus sp. PS3-12 TaxID=3070677 RepID=UPI0027E1632D|nr:DUF2088 domain-containing protein [Neobacillus sp. PS3-12]WML50793.1 DUF2088 domain-containing protein [Neobacillus sp. PS3-12]